MKRLAVITAAGAVCALSTLAWGQQGGGSGFGGGFQGGYGGAGGGMMGPDVSARRAFQQTLQSIDQATQAYLGSEPVTSILTPGEYCEWKIAAKTGQVVMADAQSEAFDPALEVLDAAEKVLGENDDRFPGDQRPLLLWRCPKDGEYSLRVRCFKNKSGGQVKVRFVLYDCMDLLDDKPVERVFKQQTRFLIRLPMIQGQVKQIYTPPVKGRNYPTAHCLTTLSPSGLPDIALCPDLSRDLPYCVIGAVTGDYYVLATGYGGDSPVRVAAKSVRVAKADRSAEGWSGEVSPGEAVIWSIAVKKDEVLEASLNSGAQSGMLEVDDEPPFASFDAKDDKKNPFIPVGQERPEMLSPIAKLGVRPGDRRVEGFRVLRDGRIWVLCRLYEATSKPARIAVRPLLKPFVDGPKIEERLAIGRTDYWTFAAKTGDVMSLEFGTATFAQRVTVLDPDWTPVSQPALGLDAPSCAANLVVTKPGRYIAVVSAQGDGGGGAYTVERKVLQARECSQGKPAKAKIGPGETQVWKVTLPKGEPCLVRWTSGGPFYGVRIFDERGLDVRWPLVGVSTGVQYAVMASSPMRTYTLVFTGVAGESSYEIEILPLPKPGGDQNKKPE